MINIVFIDQYIHDKILQDFSKYIEKNPLDI